MGAGRGTTGVEGRRTGCGALASAAAADTGAAGCGLISSAYEQLLRPSTRQSSRAGIRSTGVTMTKAGNKGGNLRDKLDGNELDLSLGDLNEVPVKELVSAAPGGGPGRGPRIVHPVLPIPHAPGLSFHVLRPGGSGVRNSAPGERRLPPFFPGCTRVTLAQCQQRGGGGRLLVLPGGPFAGRG